MSDPVLELFHVLADRSSAKVRRFVVDHGLEGALRFRSLTYPEVQADFSAHGGTTPPALWDGERLVEGAEAVICRLLAYGDVGRDG